MKYKLIITIILLLGLLVPSTLAAVQIQISTDNSTWESIDTSNYGGSIDEANKRAYVHNLEGSSKYYFRAKDATSSWFYFTQSTQEGGDKLMAYLMIGMIMIGVTLMFAYLSTKMKNTMAQIGFMMIAVMMVVWDFFMAAKVMEAVDSSQTGIISHLLTFYDIGITIQWLMLWGVMIYLLVLLANFFVGVTKRKRMEREELYR